MVEIENISSLIKVLVTGSNGFIGKYVAKRLEGKGYLVIYGNRRLWLSGSVDYIVHCAGCRPQDGVTIDDYIKGNINYTRLIINYAETGKTKKVIYLSTDVAHHPDDYKWPGYSTTKYLGELLLEKRSFKYDILRIGKVETETDLETLTQTILKLLHE